MRPGRQAATLLVVLDDLGGAHVRFVGIAAGVATSAALTEQIPALIEGDLDRLQPLQLLGVER